VREWAALLAEHRRRAGTLGERGEPIRPLPKPGTSEPRLGHVLIPSREPGELDRLISSGPAYRRDAFEHPRPGDSPRPVREECLALRARRRSGRAVRERAAGRCPGDAKARYLTVRGK